MGDISSGFLGFLEAAFLAASSCDDVGRLGINGMRLHRYIKNFEFLNFIQLLFFFKWIFSRSFNTL
jgi:hypothetical protein